MSTRYPTSTPARILTFLTLQRETKHQTPSVDSPYNHPSYALSRVRNWMGDQCWISCLVDSYYISFFLSLCFVLLPVQRRNCTKWQKQPWPFMTCSYPVPELVEWTAINSLSCQLLFPSFFYVLFSYLIVKCILQSIFIITFAPGRKTNEYNVQQCTR